MTIKEALKDACKRLMAVSDAPSLDAEEILLGIIGEQEAGKLYTYKDRGLSEDQVIKMNELVRRRQKGEPLAYIKGEWDFYGRSFYVDRRVLVPRPTTEDLIDKALEEINKLLARKRKIVVADIGTGSGCVAITLLLELGSKSQRLELVATDVSRPALEIAKKNADRYGVSKVIEFTEGDLLDPLKEHRADLVVSNPPYVTSREIERAYFSPTVETTGLKYEPRISLDGGKDGNKIVNKIKRSGLPFVMEIQNGEVILGNLLD